MFLCLLKGGLDQRERAASFTVASVCGGEGVCRNRGSLPGQATVPGTPQACSFPAKAPLRACNRAERPTQRGRWPRMPAPGCGDRKWCLLYSAPWQSSGRLRRLNLHPCALTLTRRHPHTHTSSQTRGFREQKSQVFLSKGFGVMGLAAWSRVR